MRTTKVVLAFVLCLGLIAQGVSQEIECDGGKFYDPLVDACVQNCTAGQNIDLEGKNCQAGCSSEDLQTLEDGQCVCEEGKLLNFRGTGCVRVCD